MRENVGVGNDVGAGEDSGKPRETTADVRSTGGKQYNNALLVYRSSTGVSVGKRNIDGALVMISASVTVAALNIGAVA